MSRGHKLTPRSISKQTYRRLLSYEYVHSQYLLLRSHRTLPRSHKLRFCPREVASSEPMASPPAPNKGRHPYPIYMPPLRRLRDRSQSSPVFRLDWCSGGTSCTSAGRSSTGMHRASACFPRGAHLKCVGTPWMDAYRHSGHTTAAASLESAGHSATASERELGSPSHSRL